MTTMYEEISNNYQELRKYRDGVSVEIEAEFSREFFSRDKFPSVLWNIHGDGSLRGHGYEFVTKRPFGDIKEARESLSKLLSLDEFTEFYSPSTRTSTHVHLNIQNWSHEELLKFLLIYYLCEQRLNQYGGKYREGNLFCLSISDASAGIKAINYLIDKKFSQLDSHFNLYKYNALNVANVARLGTVEFRQYKGTNSVEDVCNWLKVINKLSNCRNNYDSYDEIMQAYRRNPQLFIEQSTGLEVNNIDEVDENYSLVYNIYNYIITAPNRLKITSSTKRKKIYNFGPSEIDKDLL